MNNIEQHLLLGDSADRLKELKDNSIDLLATDPSYGLHFMGKDWDKALPDTEIFRECYRVLKPGSFIAVMSSPRSDLLYRMIQKLEDAGFDMSFSPILWTYHSGFPKASDVSKMIDKRLGGVVKESNAFKGRGIDNTYNGISQSTPIGEERDAMRHTPDTDLAKKYEGSKLGFQPKPAVEHIIIGMKPHGQKSYIDNVLNFEALPDNIKMTYPFIQVPKPAKKEKDMGLGEERQMTKVGDGRITENDTAYQRGKTLRKNTHPTTKPVKLMSYIITLFTREGDWVLDPFLGSGTTGVASKLINRNFVGIEREQEYMDIVKERCEVDRHELIKFFKMEKDTQTKLDL